MSDQDKDLLLDHEYDGIRELDNPLPMWWLWTFFATIIFSFMYWIHYELNAGPSSAEELQNDIAQVESLKQQAVANQPEKSEEDLLALVSNKDALSQATSIFKNNCASCHGDHAQGMIGPNLTDDYWIHGDGTLKSSITVIKTGVLNKGMPAWDGIIKTNDIEFLAAYIRSLRGSQPVNAKAPQGELKEL